MKNTLLKATAVASIISAPLLIIGCGGGSTSTTATQMSKITGTVPGTLIEAFCANGTHVTVTSVQNGTAQHPFEISVPQNTECRLVMTTNENDPVNRVVSNIGFATATATGLTLSLNQDLNLGYVPLPMDPNAVPTVNNMVVDPIIVNVDPVMDPNAPAVMDPNAPMDPNATAVMNPAAMTPATPVVPAVNNAPIAAFDANGNGIIDAYEDMNNNGIMDAFDPDYVAPAPMAPTTPTTTSDNNGSTSSSDDNYYDDSKGSSDSSYDTSSSSSDSSYDTSSSSSDSSYDTSSSSSDSSYDDDKGSSDDYDDKGSND